MARQGKLLINELFMGLRELETKDSFKREHDDSPSGNPREEKQLT